MGDMTQARDVATGEYYHVFNRGARKNNIFNDKSDWMRFLFLILYMQSPLTVTRGSRVIASASMEDGFDIPLETQEEILKKRFVELTAFCFMPNHFHLLIKETGEHGIPQYMQRVLTGYTMYFNAKHGTSGHLFQGRYKNVHVEDNEQLLYLSAYIHRNPRELKAWKDKEEQYPFSSLQDYVDKNRWGDLIKTDIVAGQFAGTPESNYRDFVRTSTAKELEEKIPTMWPE
jgi:putative transposase